MQKELCMLFFLIWCIVLDTLLTPLREEQNLSLLISLYGTLNIPVNTFNIPTRFQYNILMILGNFIKSSLGSEFFFRNGAI